MRRPVNVKRILCPVAGLITEHATPTSHIPLPARFTLEPGPFGGPESGAFREIARRNPAVTFLSGVTTAQEVTLRGSPTNHFRFTPDGAQTTAGLGTYAYRDLGWRTAVVVGEPFTDGFETAAGFIAEFCALGGTIAARDWFSLVLPDYAHDSGPLSEAVRQGLLEDLQLSERAA